MSTSTEINRYARDASYDVMLNGIMAATATEKVISV
jgi:hypothetical protein